MGAEGNIGAVVLAAGASRRFGEDNKLLAQIDGRPLIGRVLDALAEGGVADVVVVTGWDREGIAQALGDRDVHLAHNAGWEAGMGGSIAGGIAALDAAIVGAMIVPGDMPRLTARVVSSLIETFERTGRDRVVYPTTATGAQRNPVLWPRRFFAALKTLPPGDGAKALLWQLSAADRVAVAIDDDEVFLDVDTAAELDAARGDR